MSELRRRFEDRIRGAWLDLLTVALPLVILALLSLPTIHWLIDDAGISYAYARSLADGNGLVSQPGMSPVEGYSNFLWVLLLSPFFLLGLFEPYVTDKLLSFVLVAVGFVYIHRTLKLLTGGKHLASIVALSLLACNTSYVVWTSSGLENPLYSAVISVLLYLLVSYSLAQQRSARMVLPIGLVSIATALTRPEGVLYAAAFPIVATVWAISNGKQRLPGFGRHLIYYLLIFTIGYATFLVFRYLYFGDLLPNTYYAKEAGQHMDLVGLVTLSKPYLVKSWGLLKSILGPIGSILLAVAIVVFTVSGVKHRFRDGTAAVLALLLIALVGYLLLRNDYMGEYRFATPAVIMLMTVIGWFADRLIALIRSGRFQRLAATAGIIALMGTLAAIEYAPRFHQFWANPPVKFAAVKERFADRFDRYSDHLHLNDASLLVPDIGGALYYSHLRIYDLAGLCDRTIARTRRQDQKAFYDYIFGTLSPTFIHTHGYFTGVSKFEDDPRFAADYIPLNVYVDDWVGSTLGEERQSGDFMRRDLLKGRETVVDSIRQGLLH